MGRGKHTTDMRNLLPCGFLCWNTALKLSPTPLVMLRDEERARATSRSGASTFSLNTVEMSSTSTVPTPGSPHLDVQCLWGHEWLGNKPVSLCKTLVFKHIVLLLFALPQHNPPLEARPSLASSFYVFLKAYWNKTGKQSGGQIHRSPDTGLDLELCHCFHTGFTTVPS